MERAGFNPDIARFSLFQHGFDESKRARCFEAFSENFLKTRRGIDQGKSVDSGRENEEGAAISGHVFWRVDKIEELIHEIVFFTSDGNGDVFNRDNLSVLGDHNVRMGVVKRAAKKM